MKSGGEREKSNLSQGVLFHDPPTEAGVAPRVQFMMWTMVTAFMAVEGSIRAFDLYRHAPWVDVPSHLLSGAAVTAAFLHYLTRRPKGKALLAMAGNVGVALVWEAAEMIDEVLTPDPPHLKDVFIWDGFWDVVCAIVGGLIVLWLLRRSRVAETSVR